MRRNFRRMAIFCLVMAMGILPMSAHSNIASAQEQEQTGTLVMTKEDEIDSFDDLAGMTLDLSDKNIVPDDKGKVEIDVNDAVQQGSMARNMIPGSVKFKIENLTFSMTGVSELNRPIQNIYVMNSEIYVTQTYSINDKHKKQGNVKISRCVIDTKDNKTAKKVDDMNIEGVGHGQNLIPYQYNNKQYFIVCANAVNNYQTNGKEVWEANKVGRIVYDARTTKTSEDINILDDTEYSNKTREPFNNIRRCAVYVSPDNKKMLMFKQNIQKAVQYSFYDFDVVKQVLDSNSAKDMSFKSSDKLQAACYDYEINSNDLPVSQLQGIAIDNSLNIYICRDGNNNNNCRAELCVMFKLSNKTKIYDVYGEINEITDALNDDSVELEIEGIQLTNDKIYIGMAPKEEKYGKYAYIYSIDRSYIY